MNWRKISGLLLVAGVTLSILNIACAQTNTDASSGDFLLQGEYASSISGAGKLGAQVVALGGGKFDVYLLTGGLPGAGWDKAGRRKVSAAVDPAMPGIAFLSGEGWSGMIRTGSPASILSGKMPGGESFRLEKVVRESPTSGVKAPKDAIVLFDGTNADAWENGKIVEGNLLDRGPKTKQKFNDMTLHLEFRLPFMPDARGQGRGNSGVYLQNRYECQVLDSFGLTGENNECGGFYQQAKPAVNMCFPPLSWQTYDIEFTAARYDADGKKLSNAHATVRHNGVTIHDNIELTKATPGAEGESPNPGALFLQNHGNPVVYRNIWVIAR